MVTLPDGVMVGVEGCGVIVNTLELVAAPVGVTTDINPVVPEPTVAVMLVEELTVKELTGVPPTVTEVAPVKFAPVIFTLFPKQIIVGVKELIVGTLPP
jgi:hypothetical protein